MALQPNLEQLSWHVSKLLPGSLVINSMKSNMAKIELACVLCRLHKKGDIF